MFLLLVLNLMFCSCSFAKSRTTLWNRYIMRLEYFEIKISTFRNFFIAPFTLSQGGADFFSHPSECGKCPTRHIESPPLSLQSIWQSCCLLDLSLEIAFRPPDAMLSFRHSAALVAFGLSEFFSLSFSFGLSPLCLQSEAIWSPSLWAPTFDEYALYCCSLPESARSKTDFATGLFHIIKSSWVSKDHRSSASESCFLPNEQVHQS